MVLLDAGTEQAVEQPMHPAPLPLPQPGSPALYMFLQQIHFLFHLAGVGFSCLQPRTIDF